MANESTNGNGHPNGRSGAMTQSIFQWVITILMGIITTGGGYWATTVNSQLTRFNELAVRNATILESIEKKNDRDDVVQNTFGSLLNSLQLRIARLEERIGVRDPKAD